MILEFGDAAWNSAAFARERRGVGRCSDRNVGLTTHPKTRGIPENGERTFQNRPYWNRKITKKPLRINITGKEQKKKYLVLGSSSKCNIENHDSKRPRKQGQEREREQEQEQEQEQV